MIYDLRFTICGRRLLGLLLCFLLTPVSGLLSPVAVAATVTGSVKTAGNVALVGGTVRFSPLDAPLAAAPDLIAAGDVLATTDSVGAYSQTLAAGNYKVTLPNSRSFGITVPTGDSTYSVLDLVTGGLKIGGNYVPGGPSTVPLATTNVAGKLFTASLSTNPVVPLVADLNSASNTLAGATTSAAATALANLNSASNTLAGATTSAAATALANLNSASNTLAGATTTAAATALANLNSASNTLAAADSVIGTRATNAIPSTNGVAYVGLTVDGLLFNRTNQLCRDAVAGTFLAVTNALRDSFGNLTNAGVTWVDGRTGTLTASGSSLGLTNLAVTYINGGVTNTLTIQTLSRNPDGSVAWSTAPTFN